MLAKEFSLRVLLREVKELSEVYLSTCRQCAFEYYALLPKDTCSMKPLVPNFAKTNNPSVFPNDKCPNHYQKPIGLCFNRVASGKYLNDMVCHPIQI